MCARCPWRGVCGAFAVYSVEECVSAQIQRWGPQARLGRSFGAQVGDQQTVPRTSSLSRGERQGAKGRRYIRAVRGARGFYQKGPAACMGKAELGANSQQAAVSLFLSLVLHPHGYEYAPDVCQRAPCVGVLAYLWVAHLGCQADLSGGRRHMDHLPLTSRKNSRHSSDSGPYCRWVK